MKYRIKIRPNSQSIQIPLKSNAELSGLDDDVLSLINDKTNESVNEVNDNEKLRFLPTQSININFGFWNGTGFTNVIAPSDFGLIGLSASSTQMRESFYIVQLYTSFNDSIQTKLHTGYYNGYEFTRYGNVSTYPYNSSIEFTNFYLRKSYVDSLSGNTYLYAKFNFYSATSGKVYPFFNLENNALTTEEKLYFKLLIIPSAMTYTFIGIVGNLDAREVRNTQYVQFINDTLESIPVEAPTYPTGNTFTSDGIYIQQ